VRHSHDPLIGSLILSLIPCAAVVPPAVSQLRRALRSRGGQMHLVRGSMLAARGCAREAGGEPAWRIHPVYIRNTRAGLLLVGPC